MAFAASSTTKRPSETCISTYIVSLMRVTASNMLWLNAESFFADGEMTAIRNGSTATVVSTAASVVTSGANVSLVLSELLLHPVAAKPSAANNDMASTAGDVRARFLIVNISSFFLLFEFFG